jgi:hypothetical protein
MKFDEFLRSATIHGAACGDAFSLPTSTAALLQGSGDDGR